MLLEGHEHFGTRETKNATRVLITIYRTHFTVIPHTGPVAYAVYGERCIDTGPTQVTIRTDSDTAGIPPSHQATSRPLGRFNHPR